MKLGCVPLTGGTSGLSVKVKVVKQKNSIAQMEKKPQFIK